MALDDVLFLGKFIYFFKCYERFHTENKQGGWRDAEEVRGVLGDSRGGRGYIKGNRGYSGGDSGYSRGAVD